MTKVVVFVEEPSARIIVEGLALRLAPNELIKVVQHEGKSDLVSSFLRKIRAWRHPVDVPFIVLHDNDGGACNSLKARLDHLVPEACKKRTRVRIVMQALESWYLGDLPALAAAGLLHPERAGKLSRQAKYRDPEVLANPKQEFMRLHGQSGQLLLARQIAPHLDLEANRSRSFRLFIATLKRLAM